MLEKTVSLAEAFEEFISNRTIEELSHLFLGQPEYHRLLKELDDYQAQLMEYAPESNDERKKFAKLIEEVNNAAMLLSIHRGEVLYKQGLREGIKLAAILEIELTKVVLEENPEEQDLYRNQ